MSGIIRAIGWGIRLVVASPSEIAGIRRARLLDLISNQKTEVAIIHRAQSSVH
jgi:hypothetical protein